MTIETTEIANLYGLSGEEYEFGAHSFSIGISWESLAAPGIYVFARRIPHSNAPVIMSSSIDVLRALHYWKLIYIGQSRNVLNRLANYKEDEWECILKHRPTHLLFRKSSATESMREIEEKDLIKEHNPPCNTQHISAPPPVPLVPSPPPPVPFVPSPPPPVPLVPSPPPLRRF